MGDKLVKFYDKVLSEHGSIGLYRLVVKTRISRELAGELEDSEENMKKIQDAVESLGLRITAVEVIKRRGLLSRLLRRK